MQPITNTNGSELELEVVTSVSKKTIINIDIDVPQQHTTQRWVETCCVGSVSLTPLLSSFPPTKSL